MARRVPRFPRSRFCFRFRFRFEFTFQLNSQKKDRCDVAEKTLTGCYRSDQNDCDQTNGQPQCLCSSSRRRPKHKHLQKDKGRAVPLQTCTVLLAKARQTGMHIAQINTASAKSTEPLRSGVWEFQLPPCKPSAVGPGPPAM